MPESARVSDVATEVPETPETPEITAQEAPAIGPRRRPVVPWDLLRKAAPLLTVLLFAGALWLLHRELAGFRYHDVMMFLRTLPRSRVWLAVLFTALGYAAMTGYDTLAFRNIREPMPYRRISHASFVGYSFSNSRGHPLFPATPIRARLYSGWGLSALQVTRIVVF